MKRFILILLIIPSMAHSQTDIDIQLANEYYLKGEMLKARELYKTLAADRNNIAIIHNNYFTILLTLEDYKEADKYIKKVLKSFPANVYYRIDQGVLYKTVGETTEAAQIFDDLIQESITNEYQVRAAAQYFLSNDLNDYARQIYEDSRKINKDKTMYALELASVYRIMGNKDAMINEYLLFGSMRTANLVYVKNILQSLLNEMEDIDSFQNLLIDKIQKYPNDEMYSDLLIWSYLQQNNFHGAYVQARALDKRFNRGGQHVMEIGQIAMENHALEDAIEIFQYVVDNNKGTANYSLAKRSIIQCREEKVKSVVPIDLAVIQLLTEDYQRLINELGITNQTLEAFRSKALLHAFYLDQKDTAINILNQIISMPGTTALLKAKCKLDLGDIFLLLDQPWESTLLYAQVEKTNKDTEIAYQAKLKNARLNYFNGNFELAKSHLDILKLATTREISNDAIQLSLLITDNTFMDSTDLVMKEYARIELLQYQNKKDEALISYAEMVQKYPTHSLVDEIHWKMANIYLALANNDKALEHLKIIQTQFGDNILGDDAMFLMAQIYEVQLADPTQAMTMYNEFLMRYPGSVYSAEARKRFRKLRGDSNF